MKDYKEIKHFNTNIKVYKDRVVINGANNINVISMDLLKEIAINLQDFNIKL